MQKSAMHNFPDWFTEAVVFEGQEYRLIFDVGSTKKRVVRGTEISDTRPFLWGKLPEKAKGHNVLVRQKKYNVETIEQVGENSFVYFLGENRKAHEI